MRVLITAGGGGHFSPALAVISRLPKDTEYILVGRKYTYEGSDTLSHEYLFSEKNQLPFIPLTTGRLQRSFSRYTIPSLLKIPIGLWQARKIIRDFRPDVVMSFGGYVTVPVVMAAAQKKIPVLLHEQTQGVGLANKIASRFAKVICISWKSSEKYFPKEKTLLTGNPVKEEILTLLSKRGENHEGIRQIFITGGSQGSHKLNLLLKDALPKLLHHAKIIHLTGDAKQFDDYNQLNLIRDGLDLELRDRYTTFKFLDAKVMLETIASSSLIISRCGINTLTELLLLQKPAIVMPLKDGQKHEQEKNAQMFVATGLGEMIDEDTITVTEFEQKVEYMLSHLSEYRITSEIPEVALHLTAAQTLTNLILDVGNKTQNKTS